MNGSKFVIVKRGQQNHAGKKRNRQDTSHKRIEL